MTATVRPPRSIGLWSFTFWACAIAFTLAVVAGGVWASRLGSADWPVMQNAWVRVGTPALLDPPQRWQIFAYLPATAYLLALPAALPLSVGFAANAVGMILCAAVAGVLAARLYALPAGPAIGLFATWPPAVYAAALVGQNAALGLLLSVLALTGIAAKSALLTAAPIGLLLYKPTYAAPFIIVLVARRMWRECAIVGGCALGWYFLSVAASGGNWNWPATWARMIASYAAGDLAYNGPLSISAFTTLLRAGAPLGIAGAGFIAAAAFGYLAIVRSSALEAATGAMLLALAWSPHAWAYDAVLALPAVACALGRLRPRARVVALFTVYGIASALFLSRSLGFDPLLFVTVGGSSAWVVTAATARRSK